MDTQSFSTRSGPKTYSNFTSQGNAPAQYGDYYAPNSGPQQNINFYLNITHNYDSGSSDKSKIVEVSATKEPPARDEHTASGARNAGQGRERARRPSLTVPAPIGQSQEKLVAQTLERAGLTAGERHEVVQTLREARPGSYAKLSWPSKRLDGRQELEKAGPPVESAISIPARTTTRRELPSRKRNAEYEREQVYERITKLINHKGFDEVRRRCSEAAFRKQNASYQFSLQSQRRAELRILETQFDVDLSDLSEDHINRLASASFGKQVEFVLRSAYSNDPDKCVRDLDGLEKMCKSSISREEESEEEYCQVLPSRYDA